MSTFRSRGSVQRRSSQAAVATAGFAVVGVLAWPAMATGANHDTAPQTSSSADHHREQDLRLALRRVSETEVDVGEKGYGPGDYAVTQDSVTLNGKSFGRTTQLTTLMAVTPTPSLHCSLNLALPSGQVALQGSFKLPRSPSDPAPQLAVTGGTGSYQGVYGQATETASKGDVNFISLHLVFPN